MKKILPIFICISIVVQLFTVSGVSAETADAYIGMPPEPEIVIIDDTEITQSNDNISLFDIGDLTPEVYRTSLYYEDEYFEAYFKGRTLYANGKIRSNKANCMIMIKDGSGTEIQRTTAAVISHTYTINADLSDLINRTYYLSLYFNTTSESDYWSTLRDIPFYVTNEGIVFEHPFTEDENIYYKSFIEDEVVDENFYLKIPEDELTTAQYNEIAATAVSITIGCETDYEKIVAVHDYIAENTYYDSIAARANTISVQADPWFVYTTHRGVCTGIARLMRAMLVSLDIPTVCVLGFAESGVNWDSNTEYIRNHEWNWVYYEEQNRWMIIDTTWDCGNKFDYPDGDKTKEPTEIDGDVGYMYFDADNDAFSTTHKTDGMRRNDVPWTNYFIIAAGNVCYNLTDTGFEFTTFYDNPTELTLGISINGYTMSRIPENFMRHYDFSKKKWLPDDSIVSVMTISASITEIGDYAFFGAKNLETVYCYANIAKPINIESGIFLAGEKTPVVYCYTNSYMYSYLEAALQAYNNTNVVLSSLTGDTLKNVCLYYWDGDTVLEFELADSFSGGRMFLAYYKGGKITYCKSAKLTSGGHYYDDISDEYDDDTIIKLFIWEDNIKPYGSRTILYRLVFNN